MAAGTGTSIGVATGRPRRAALRCAVYAAVLAFGALAGALADPLPAVAHAVLVSSSPAAGATVGTTPGQVRLTFDEPLAAALSGATVTDPAGHRSSGAVSGETIRVPLRTALPGVYRVAWATVSDVDGHTVHGGFRFGVGTPAGAGPSGTSTTPYGGDVLVSVLRAIEYGALLLACGLVVLRRLGRDLPVRVPAVPVAAVLWGAGVAVVLAEATSAAGRLTLPLLGTYLSIGGTGAARAVRLAGGAGLVTVALIRRRLSPLLLGVVVVALAAAGHAANVTPGWVGIAVNAAHLAAAGAWAGGIMALALLRWTGQWACAGRDLVRRFGRVAPWAFTASVGLGAVQAVQLLGSPAGMLRSPYGLTLAVKVVVVAAMLPLSLLAWRRRRPMVRAEALLAALVVLVAAALAAYPTPVGAGVATGGAGPTTDAASPYPRAGDLTLAGLAGQTMVGLTLRPGRPGPNQVVAFLAPDPAATVPVALSSGGGATPLTPCGTACRSGTADLVSGQRLAVSVGGPHGGTLDVAVAALPAPDGSSLVSRATAWMRTLGSYQVDENLAGIRSHYAFALPHRMYLRMWLTGGTRDTVWSDGNMYRRNAPAGTWSAPVRTAPVPVPYFAWEPFRPFVAPAVIGGGTVDGVPVTLVSFFGGHGPDPEPVWFTLSIDVSAGRVLRSVMWAPGHWMDDRYSAFNQPADIPDPAGG